MTEVRIERSIDGLISALEETEKVLRNPKRLGWANGPQSSVLEAYVAWLRSLDPLRDRQAWWALKDGKPCRECKGSGVGPR